jgi:hypothetical protein
MPKDFEPFNWNDETKIDCRAPDGSDEAKFSQSRIMGNLLKALKLKIEEKDFNSQESEVIEFVKHYQAHVKPILSLVVSIDQKMLVTSSYDGYIKFFETLLRCYFKFSACFKNKSLS